LNGGSNLASAPPRALITTPMRTFTTWMPASRAASVARQPQQEIFL
jgi:hypothetical protein